MANDIKFKIEGLDRVEKVLSKMGKSVNQKVMYDVNRAGGNLMKKELEKATPQGNNDKKSKNKAAANVTVVKSPSRTGVFVGFLKRSFWIKFLERGTKKRIVKGKRKGRYKGANRGSMSAKPFVHKTYLQNYQKVVKYLSDNYLKIIYRSIGKQLKRVGK